MADRQVLSFAATIATVHIQKYGGPQERLLTFKGNQKYGVPR